MLEYWKQYPDLQKQLTTVQELIQQQLTIKNPKINETLKDLLNAPGKMLRPALFLLFANLGNKEKQNQDQLIKIAASLEILHMATLVHDDIIDDSPLRHGAITTQAKYGKDIAVYTGDLLFTVFFELILDTMTGTDFLRINANAMKKILFGELDQLNNRYKSEQALSEYIDIIGNKTAELFYLACFQGAYFGNSSHEVQEIAGKIGRNIGIAFQIYDDILDYTADEKTLKKPVLEDLTEGIYTLPLLLAKQNHNDEFKPLLAKQNQLTHDDAKRIQELVVKYDGIKQAKEMAQNYTNQALGEIDSLPKSNGQKLIKQLANKLLSRKF